MRFTHKPKTAAICTLLVVFSFVACQKNSLQPQQNNVAANAENVQALARPFISFGTAPTDSVIIHQDTRTAAFTDSLTVNNVSLVYLKGCVFTLRSDSAVVITKAKVKIGINDVPANASITDSAIGFTFNKPVALVGNGPFTFSMSLAGTAAAGTRLQATLQRVAAYDSLGTRLFDVRNLPQKGYSMTFVNP